MAQKTTIDGTAYAISGGKTTVDGTAYDISFGAKEYTLTVVGKGSASKPYLTYKTPTSTSESMIIYAGTRTLPEGTILKAVVGKGTGRIYVNNVSQGSGVTTYEFTMTSDVTVEFSGSKIYITTE